MKEITNEMLKDLFADDTFISQLSNAHTDEEYLDVFADNGLDMTKEEAEACYDQGLNLLEAQGYMQDGELTEKGLELVAGGARYGVANFGLAVETGGVLALMYGGASIATGGTAMLVGALIALGGLAMPSKKSKKKNKKNKRG